MFFSGRLAASASDDGRPPASCPAGGHPVVGRIAVGRHASCPTTRSHLRAGRASARPDTLTLKNTRDDVLMIINMHGNVRPAARTASLAAGTLPATGGLLSAAKTPVMALCIYLQQLLDAQKPLLLPPARPAGGLCSQRPGRTLVGVEQRSRPHWQEST